MKDLPRDPSFDCTFALLVREGYNFVTNRCRHYCTDAFIVRVMFRKAVCIQGAEAAEQFYRPGRFTRRRALPIFALALIQDVGSVMVMDGDDHRRRKAMFLSLMSTEELARLANSGSLADASPVVARKIAHRSVSGDAPALMCGNLRMGRASSYGKGS